MTYNSKHVLVAHNGNKTCIDRLWRSLERADIESILEKVEIVASDTTVTAYRLYVDAAKLEEAQKLLEDRSSNPLTTEQSVSDYEDVHYAPIVIAPLN